MLVPGTRTIALCLCNGLDTVKVCLVLCSIPASPDMSERLDSLWRDHQVTNISLMPVNV